MRTFSFLVIVLLCFSSFSQVEKTTYFGLQFRPIFPTNAGGKEITKLIGSDFTTETKQSIGYSFGGIVRRGITEYIFFESGINFTQRNFQLEMKLNDNSLTAQDKWSFITYDIPVNALIFIKLSPKYYMNTSLGGALRFSPSNIKKVTQTGTEHSFINYGIYKNKVGINLNANVGFEYRTDRKGSFYLGGSICVPVNGIIDLYSFHAVQAKTNQTYQTGVIAGRYMSIDFRYFFPNLRPSGPTGIKGPIE